MTLGRGGWVINMIELLQILNQGIDMLFNVSKETFLPKFDYL